VSSAGSNQATRIATAVATILSAGVLQLAPVQAANYGGFGSTYSEVVDPKKAEMSETFKSDEVKTALDGLKAYSSAVATMRSDLVSLPPVPVPPLGWTAPLFSLLPALYYFHCTFKALIPPTPPTLALVAPCPPAPLFPCSPLPL
jgi:hypothetical protein